MKTRRRHQIDHKIKSRKVADIKLKINKFINPSTTYRLFNSLFIEENLLTNSASKYIPHQSLFQLNKISRGIQEGDFLKFSLLPISRQFQVSDDYIIERFLSFGEANFKKLADSISQLKQFRNQIQKVMSYLPKQNDLIALVDTKRPVLVIYDDPQSLNYNSKGSLSSISISLSLMKNFGFTDPEEYIFQCIKNGRLIQPFLVNPNQGTEYVERMTWKVDGIVKAIKQALKQKNMRQILDNQQKSNVFAKNNSQSTINTLQKYFSSKVIDFFQSYNDRSQITSLHSISTPFVYCSQHIKTVHTPLSKEQLTQTLINNFQGEDELQIFSKLMPVPKNKLKRFQNKVCTFRDIDKSQNRSMNRMIVQKMQ